MAALGMAFLLSAAASFLLGQNFYQCLLLLHFEFFYVVIVLFGEYEISRAAVPLFASLTNPIFG